MNNDFDLYDFFDGCDLLQDYLDYKSDKKLIVGNFSRRALDKCFGFSSLGMDKHGVQSDMIDRNSKAVKNGTVKVKIDGTIDKRCQAVKQGLVTFKDNGKLNVNKTSELIKSKELRTLSTNASHINSFEVADAVFKASGLSLSRQEAEQLIRSLNRDDNLPLKTISGNLSGTLTMRDGGDRALDKEIASGILNGTNLSPKAAARARRQIAVILNSKGDMPDKVIETYKCVYKNLKAADGKVICRQNAKVSTFKEGESRNWYSISETAAQTGRKTTGEPDLRTSKGNAILQRKETGLTAEGKPDLRTLKGKEIQARITKEKEMEQQLLLKQQQQQQRWQQHEEQKRRECERKEMERQLRHQQERERQEVLERQQQQARREQLQESGRPHFYPPTPPAPVPMALFTPGVSQFFGGPPMFHISPSPSYYPQPYHHHIGGHGRLDIPFQTGSVTCGDGMKFFKGGQFVPGGGRAPKGGGFY